MHARPAPQLLTDRCAAGAWLAGPLEHVMYMDPD
eukprot:COSAG04_NODE_14817_length_554_cov_0.843956_2_plen_33_part_01